MALKQLKTKAAPAAAKQEMPTIACEAGYTKPDNTIVPLITEFNLAKNALKEATEAVKLMEPEVKRIGVAEWIKANVGRVGEPISSIKLVDPLGSVLRLTGQDRYPIADADPVQELFETDFHLDVNEFVQLTLKASFNNGVFLDKDGNFSESIYNAFNAAIQAVADKFKVQNPLSSKQVLQPKPGFHKDRWTKFNVVQQKQIFGVMPNVIALSPQVTAKEQVVAGTMHGPEAEPALVPTAEGCAVAPGSARDSQNASSAV
jgi:hypothetical protein